MAISNPNPESRDIVIIQRDDSNSYYGETHISGSNLILYIDAQGHINADTSGSFYTMFPPSGSVGGGGGAGLITGSLVPITSSQAISSSWARNANPLITGSLVPITASQAVSASWSPGSSPGTTLNTGSIYYITSSQSVSASWAPNTGGGSNLATGSLVPITSSWALSASNALNSLTSSFSSVAYSSSVSTTSSFATFALNGGTTLSTGSLVSITASQAVSSSWAGSSLSSSFAQNSNSSSFSLNSISSSFSTVAYTASFVGTSSQSITASFANTSSQAFTASALNVIQTSTNINFFIPLIATGSSGRFTGSGQVVYVDTSSILYNPSTDVLTVNYISASSVTASLQGTSSWAQTASVLIGSISSASFASNAYTASLAITASFAMNGGGSGSPLATGSLVPITASQALSASFAPGSGGGTTLTTASTYPITSSWAVSASVAVYAPMDILQIQVFS